jgi:hypothetical protein
LTKSQAYKAQDLADTGTYDEELDAAIERELEAEFEAKVDEIEMARWGLLNDR